MIKKSLKIKRDSRGNIICEKHNIKASSICVEENCQNTINCIICLTNDNHFHLKNINIYNLLDKDIENDIYNKEIFYNEEKIIEFIKEEIEFLRIEMLKDINLFEKKMINIIKNESLEHIIIKNKKLFQEKRKDFFENNQDLDLIKNMANQFFIFSKIQNSKDYLCSEKILENLRDGLKNFKTEIKNTFENFNIKRIGNKKKYIKKTEDKNFEEIKNNFLIKPKIYFFEDSKIIKQKDITFFFDKLFEKKIKSTKLLYRGSENEFLASKFHKLCDNKGATLTIIKSDTNKIFGGYIYNSWKVDNRVYYCNHPTTSLAQAQMVQHLVLVGSVLFSFGLEEPHRSCWLLLVLSF